jgi:VanZ family protein
MMPKRNQNILLVLYAGLIIYGSLYPFSGWRWPNDYTTTVLGWWWPRHISKSDLITNLIIYIPLGFLFMRILCGRLKTVSAIFLVTIMGMVFSFAMEFLQMFIPARESSFSDVVLNGISTLAGTLIAGCGWEGTILGQRLRVVRRAWFSPGKTVDLGLTVLGFWALSQLAPFVPSLDIGNLRHGLSLLWLTLCGMEPFNIPVMAVYALDIAGLAGIALLAAVDRMRVTVAFIVFAGAVLLLKVPIIGRQLSLEAAAGYGVAMLVVPVIVLLRRSLLVVTAMVAIYAAFVIDELRPVAEALSMVHTFNWVPFRGQMANLMGFASILEGIWPFAAMAFLCQTAKPRHSRLVAVFAGLFIAITAFVLEWKQQFIPGRYPDITAVVLAVAGWSIPWMLEVWNVQSASTTRASQFEGPKMSRAAGRTIE